MNLHEQMVKEASDLREFFEEERKPRPEDDELMLLEFTLWCLAKRRPKLVSWVWRRGRRVWSIHSGNGELILK